MNYAILVTYFHPMFKLKWILGNLDESIKIRIQNLCINMFEHFESSDKLHFSDVSEEHNFFIFSSSGSRQGPSTDS
jgi:hypothetical protein